MDGPQVAAGHGQLQTSLMDGQDQLVEVTLRGGEAAPPTPTTTTPATIPTSTITTSITTPAAAATLVAAAAAARASLAAERPGACHVRAVPGELAAGVHQQELPRTQLLVIPAGDTRGQRGIFDV